MAISYVKHSKYVEPEDLFVSHKRLYSMVAAFAVTKSLEKGANHNTFYGHLILMTYIFQYSTVRYIWNLTEEPKVYLRKLLGEPTGPIMRKL